MGYPSLDIPIKGRIYEEQDESAMGSLNVREFFAKLLARLGGTPGMRYWHL
jgi:hypothetical protein